MQKPATIAPSTIPLWREFMIMTKPRVNMLIVFCAVIGMFLAIPASMPWSAYPWHKFLLGTLGIALFSGAAAVINCLVEQKLDALMARTRARPLPRGQVSSKHTLWLALLMGAAGMLILGMWVNTLTMWLTFATFVGYAIIYTIILKPRTPQNIVIGGLSGAMPPVLGWAAVTGGLTADAWVLCLIIFAWTPPHFWALALYRKADYARAGLPMLPVTHGDEYTRLQILLYTLVLIAITLLPLVTNMSGLVYAIGMFLLNVVFLAYAWRIFRAYTEALAKRTFAYSILYLSLLFTVLLVDHYCFFPLQRLIL